MLGVDDNAYRSLALGADTRSPMHVRIIAIIRHSASVILVKLRRHKYNTVVKRVGDL
jgi:hypothetical protein